MTSNLAALQEQKQKNVRRAFEGRKNMVASMGFCLMDLGTYNSTPEMSPG